MRKSKITLRAGFTLNVGRGDLTEYGGLALWREEREFHSQNDVRTGEKNEPRLSSTSAKHLAQTGFQYLFVPHNGETSALPLPVV